MENVSLELLTDNLLFNGFGINLNYMAIKIIGTTSGVEVESDATSKALRTSLYDSAGREISYQKIPTFAASMTFTPPATPTDMVVLSGSATKTIRVISFKITTTNTAAGSQQFNLLKRSTAASGGTLITAISTPLDSNNTATAVCGHYTANPTMGVTVGTLATMRVASPVLLPATFAGIVQDAGYEMLYWMQNSLLDQPVVLRGTAQQLVLNFAGAALVAGQVHTYSVVWMEE